MRRLLPRVGPAGAVAVGTTAPDPAPGLALEIRDLHFAYPRNDRAIYSGLDLTVRAGESLAIVGSNGAGKTTLAKLLCRFYDPTAGTIRADGVDLTALDPAAWRARVTAVFQDVMRLERSLRDNVDPGRPRHGRRGRATRSATPVPRGSPSSTSRWRRATRAAPTCPAASGNGSPWPARCAPSAAPTPVPGWCCSTSRPPTSTYAGRR